MSFDFFTYFAWCVIALLFLVAVIFIIWLGSQPGKIARQRNHPQADAINACSWIGLLLAGVGWPIAFVWAFLKSGPVGYNESGSEALASGAEIGRLNQRIAELESQLAAATKEGGSKT